MRRKENRKRRDWNGFPSEEGVGVEEKEEEDASVWRYEHGGGTLKACERKERQDTKAIFIDLLCPLWLCLPSAVQHKAHTGML